VLLAIDLFLAPHSHNAPAGEPAEVAGEPPAAGL
jgi:hypothetical protein